MKKVLAIINPISGGKSKNNVPELLREAYNDREEELFISYTKRAGHASLIAHRAIEEGYQTIIAIGGDGTVNEVAQALLHTDVSFGIIPMGSGNGLARALGISMNTQKAIQQLCSSREIWIDSCKINDKPFFCTTGMGFDAEVSHRFSESATRGALSYVRTAVTEYIRFKPQHYRLTLDTDNTLETNAFVIAIANASQYGNNAYIAPNASMTDGLMDLVILKPFSEIEMPQVVMQLFTKKLEKNSNRYSTHQVKSVRIERLQEGPIHIDGEPIIMPRVLEVGIVPHSLKVLAPIDADIHDE